MLRSGSRCVLLALAAGAAQACSGAGASGARSDGAAASVALSARGARHELRLASGTALSLRSRDGLTSRFSQLGDVVVATSLHPALSATGDTVIPAGAEFEGIVTAIAPAPNPRADGRLGIEFSEVRFGGRTYPVRTRLLGVATQRVGRGITGGTVLKVGAGAAAGGIVGRLIGGNATGTLVGAAAGAAAGGVYAHETRHLDVVLPRGGLIRIALAAPFQP